MFEVGMALFQTVIENPVLGPALFATARTISGYLQAIWKDKTGKDFDKKEFAATLLKYEVAINAVVPLVPDKGKVCVGALVILADILGSWARKLRKFE